MPEMPAMPRFDAIDQLFEWTFNVLGADSVNHAGMVITRTADGWYKIMAQVAAATGGVEPLPPDKAMEFRTLKGLLGYLTAGDRSADHRPDPRTLQPPPGPA